MTTTAARFAPRFTIEPTDGTTWDVGGQDSEARRFYRYHAEPAAGAVCEGCGATSRLAGVAIGGGASIVCAACIAVNDADPDCEPVGEYAETLDRAAFVAIYGDKIAATADATLARMDDALDAEAA